MKNGRKKFGLLKSALGEAVAPPPPRLPLLATEEELEIGILNHVCQDVFVRHNRKTGGEW
jgi:hypothetical protein